MTETSTIKHLGGDMDNEGEVCPFCDTRKRYDSNLGEVFCPNRRCFE